MSASTDSATVLDFSKSYRIRVSKDLAGLKILFLSNDVINAAWNAGVGVHALIWVGLSKMAISSDV